MKVSIYTMTHREFQPPADTTYVPLQVGAAVNPRLGYQGDDSGENISELNCYYSELTGLYWVWKNDRDSDIIGSCHYRRFLVNSRNIVLTAREIQKLLEDYDIITTKKVHLNNSYRFGFAANHNVAALDMAGEVIRDLYPEYHDAYVRLVNGPDTYFGNMIIARRGIYCEYCEWLFAIFDELRKRINLDTDEDAYHKRVLGFISEFLLGVWISVRGLRVHECMVGMFGEKTEITDLKHRIAECFLEGDEQSAKRLIVDAISGRPDLLMEASDITGELRMSMELIAITEEEREKENAAILDEVRDFGRLMELVDELNTRIYREREGESVQGGYAFSQAALNIARLVLPHRPICEPRRREEPTERLVIIGGGVAGLSAGIFGRRAGLDTVIYEKNNIAGGSCGGWYRKGCAIDNCVRWLTGTAQGSSLNKLWRELGVIDDSTVYVKRDSFITSEHNGRTVSLWRDAQRSREELLAIAPEDADEINSFIDTVLIGRGEIENRAFFMKAMKYFGLTNEKWAQRFKSPVLRAMILDFCPKEYEPYWLILSYSFYIYGNADLIDGGSVEIAKRLTDTYLREGGRLVLGSEVSKVIVEESGVSEDKKFRAKGVELCSGEFISADYCICACDTKYVFEKLLGAELAPKVLRNVCESPEKYPLYSAFQVAFRVDGLFEEIPDQLYFDCEEIRVANQSVNRIGVVNYRKYGSYIAPESQTVIQVSVSQYSEDCKYWEELYCEGEKEGESRYISEKLRLAGIIQRAIIARFPKYDGRLELLDVWTPYSYKRRNRLSDGAFMRYITTVISANAFIPCELLEARNVYLASHWLRFPGGLPAAAQAGKDAIDHLLGR